MFHEVIAARRMDIPLTLTHAVNGAFAFPLGQTP